MALDNIDAFVLAGVDGDAAEVIALVGGLRGSGDGCDGIGFLNGNQTDDVAGRGGGDGETAVAIGDDFDLRIIDSGLDGGIVGLTSQ